MKAIWHALSWRLMRVAMLLPFMRRFGNGDSEQR